MSDDDLTPKQLLESISNLFRVQADMIVTKDEFKKILKDEIQVATKDDLKGFATKEDLKAVESRMATKDDLKAFATKDDLRASEERIKAKIISSRSISNKHHIETRNMIGDIEKELGDLKDELHTPYEM